MSIVHHDGHVILRNTAVVASQFKFLTCIGMYARRPSRCTHGQTLETDPSQRKAWKCKKLQISDIFTYLTFLVPVLLVRTLFGIFSNDTRLVLAAQGLAAQSCLGDS